MSSSKALPRDFIAALVANEAARYEQVLAEDASLRLWRWDGVRRSGRATASCAG